MHGAAGLAEAVPGQVRGAFEVRAGGGQIGGVRDDLELGDDPGQALGDGVVDLGGQPPAFVGDARFPRLEEELGVKGGVLVEGLLQSRVGAFECGDGDGPLTGTLLLLPADAADHRQQAEVGGQQHAEQQPLDRAFDRHPTGLRARHHDDGGEQAEPLPAPSGDQFVAVEVAGGRVEPKNGFSHVRTKEIAQRRT